MVIDKLAKIHLWTLLDIVTFLAAKRGLPPFEVVLN